MTKYHFWSDLKKRNLLFQVKGRDVGFQTTKEGEFWRILLPGIYTMEVFAEGYKPREVQFAIVEQNPTLLNVTLQRDVKVLSKATDVPTKINTKLPKESTKKGASKPVVTSDEENEDLVDEKV